MKFTVLIAHDKFVLIVVISLQDSCYRSLKTQHLVLTSQRLHAPDFQFTRKLPLRTRFFHLCI